MDWSKLDLPELLKRPRSVLASLWSTVAFDSSDYVSFARPQMESAG